MKTERKSKRPGAAKAKTKKLPPKSGVKPGGVKPGGKGDQQVFEGLGVSPGVGRG